MHGRIIRAGIALLLLVPPAVASGHDVHMKAIFASVPSATWDASAHTWTLGLAGMIDCDANGERVDGAVFAQLAGGAPGPLAVLQLSGTPRQVFRSQSQGLAPGDYSLNFAAAACSAQAQGDDDQGQHGDSYENVELLTFTLPDCDKPAAVYARSFAPRPLIPVDPSLPPNGPIACPVPPPPPCSAGPRSVFRHPLLPVHGTGVTVEPCTPSGSDQPAAKVRCRSGTARIAAYTAPLVVPPSGPLPRSTKKKCFGEAELDAAPAKPRTCTRPLVPVPCTPKPTDPAMGYTASIERLKRIRFVLGVGRTESFVLKLSKSARAIAARDGTTLRFVIRVRDRMGRMHRATSSQFTLEPS